MEESRYVDPTLDVYRRLRAGGTTNVGIVLQAYLYRSERDLESLLELEPNVRICKGAYLEPPDVAYPEKKDVDAAYVRLLELALRRAGFVGIATHDERMIEHAIAFVAREQIPGERFQFQMLYGVRPKLQLSLVRRGYPVLVATPYGPDWYRYSCAAWPSGRRTSASCCETSCAAEVRRRSSRPAGRTRRRCRGRV